MRWKSGVSIAALLLGAANAQTVQPVVNYATSLAGSGHDAVAGIAVDASGNTWVAGTTSSLDFPTRGTHSTQPRHSSFLRIEGTTSSWSQDTTLASPFLFAASANTPGLVYAVDLAGLHKSTDGAGTFVLLASQPWAQPLQAVTIDPNNANTLYAGSPDGLWKSTDGATSWTKLGGLPNSTFSVLQIGVDPSDSRVVIALINSGLFRSGDGGASWTEPVLPGRAFTFDASRPGVIFAVSFGVLKSTNHGSSFEQISTTTLTQSIFPDPFHPGVLYSGGMRSTDDGLTWKFVFQPSFNPFFAADPSTKGLYTSLGTHMVRSSDGFAHVETIGPPSVPFMRVFAVGAGLTPGGSPRIYIQTEIATDLFVSKLDPKGNVLFSSYLGGSSGDTANALALDASGNVYITGQTASLDFPVTQGAYMTAFPATPAPGSESLPTSSGFLVKLNQDGEIVYSTFFAGRRTIPKAIAVDTSGSVYLTGVTSGDLPVTPGAYQSTLLPPCGFAPCSPPLFSIAPIFQSPVTNAFVARFNPSGSTLQFSTYLGNNGEKGIVIAVDKSGNIDLAGGEIVYQMNSSGTVLLRSTRLTGGSVAALTVDQTGAIYVAGTAQPGFYSTSSAFQRQAPLPPPLPGGTLGYGPGDAFVAKLQPDLSIVSSSVFGGESVDGATGIALDSKGQLTVTGVTNSRSFPLLAPTQSLFSPQTGFLARLSSDLSTLQYSTYVGNQSQFIPVAVALTPEGNPVFAGYTATNNILLNEGPAFPANADDVWITGLGLNAPAVATVNTVINPASGFTEPIAPNEPIAVRGTGFGDGAQLLLDGVPVTPLSQSSSEIVAIVPASYQTRPGPDAVIQVKLKDGQLSNPFLVPVARVAPAVYSADGTGFGQGYILNQDGTRNSPTNPAAEGSIITIFATGVGVTTHVNQSDVTAQPVNVFIDGFYANGVDARVGPVPGLPGDVYQVKVIVPHPVDLVQFNPNLLNFKMPPTVPVRLDIGGVSSPGGISLSVK